MKQKILTAQITEEIYYSPIYWTVSGIQKGCHRGTRKTADLLYTDQHIFKESKERRKDVAMAWVDNEKAYGMVQQTCIVNCLKMYKLSNKVIKFITEVMKNWKVELTAGRKTLAKMKI